MDMPTETNVWIGLDIGKADHFADVLDDEGSPLLSRAVANDEAEIEALLDRATSIGSPALVVDQPGSLASLVLAVAARRGVPVAYVPGLVMRRAADLYPGEAKTDRRDAFVLADTGRTRRHQVHWLDARDDALLAQLRVLNGYDADLAADATRLSNRLRDALTGVSPALERVLGPRLHHPGVRDLLARHPVPEALAQAGRGRIARIIRKRSPRLGERPCRSCSRGPRRADRRRVPRGRDGARDRRGDRRTRPHARAPQAARGRDRGALQHAPFRAHPRDASGHRSADRGRGSSLRSATAPASRTDRDSPATPDSRP